MKLDMKTIRHFQQLISQILPFGNTKITAAKTLEAIRFILFEQPFHGYNTHHSPLMCLFYTYCEKLSYHNTVSINLQG
jgi:hypothetical protein